MEFHDIVMVMPIGYPARDNAFREPGGRRALKETLSYDSFGAK